MSAYLTTCSWEYELQKSLWEIRERDCGISGVSVNPASAQNNALYRFA
jgi:hypothetical protein